MRTPSASAPFNRDETARFYRVRARFHRELDPAKLPQVLGPYLLAARPRWYHPPRFHRMAVRPSAQGLALLEWLDGLLPATRPMSANAWLEERFARFCELLHEKGQDALTKKWTDPVPSCLASRVLRECEALFGPFSYTWFVRTRTGADAKAGSQFSSLDYDSQFYAFLTRLADQCEPAFLLESALVASYRHL